MIILDLFCGTKSIANAFEERGHTAFTVDWDERFAPSLVADIGTLTANELKILERSGAICEKCLGILNTQKGGEKL